MEPLPPTPEVPTGVSISPAPGELLRAHRRATRIAIPGLVLLWMVALVSPLLAYRADLRNAEEQLVAHLADRAVLQAHALGAHLELLRAELQRLAEHPALTPLDGLSRAELALLEGAFEHSPLFSGGVALLSASGDRVWSEPRTMDLGRSGLASRRWFRRALGERTATVDLLENGEQGLLVVVVPVVRPEGVTGLLVGELVTATQVLPGARSFDETVVVLVDPEGRVLLPARTPVESISHQMASRLRSLVDRPGPLTLGELKLFGAAAPVGGSGLLLAILEDEARDRSRLTARYLGQLGFHVALLVGVMFLFTLLLRWSYRSLLAAEERLRRQETMAALGTASSLIAHEVKNALNGMQAALSMLRPTGAADELPVEALRSQVRRLGHLARSLLSFASPRTAHYRRCELRLLVEEAIFAVRMIPDATDVNVETSLEPGIHVRGDPALLVSAIDNLVRNAVEAGAVARDTGQQAPPWVAVRLFPEGEEAVLVVEDNAGGVPPAFEPRLWEPFAVGRAKGIGLGLPMVRTAVQAHSGTVDYRRIPGGSRFTVRLPLERSPG
ncbi:MAG: ATP-binding protein [Myxococcota bacterium]|nr:ATP-binding protein [Myxococcota bacterium]